ncbi:MAG: nickel pincer cofactor biosynthesis protein LarC [Treponema sp.]|nr:nickel pincer cofactor biosynthesis protein LarC [Treponema sp.]
MKTLHFDCFAGISGDMTLGALVDLGVDPEQLRRELGKLELSGWKLEFRREQRGGITGTSAMVILDGQPEHSACDDGHHHGHSHEHTHGHNRHEHHHHNTWKEIRHVIENSNISGGAKKRALDIFTRIAAAEAQVHGLNADEVAFHEVGALDSIIDIAGAAVCLDILKPERITCGEVELGGGMVRCAHGLLPVPAPATAILVRGMPVTSGGFNMEMTTPTGAAILAASVDEFITVEHFREINSGYGTGTRKTEKPNLLRVSWRETGGTAVGRHDAHNPPDWKTEELFLLETNIDDMSGEALGFLMENLFQAGALDVTLTPCVMKKSRPGTIVSALARAETLDVLRRTFFEHSTTIGFREIPLRRCSLRRETETLHGSFGEARRKMVFSGEKFLRGKIEYDDRARLARERGIALEEAERIIAAEGRPAAASGTEAGNGPCR